MHDNLMEPKLEQPQSVVNKRFEVKYLVDESTARRVSEYASDFMDPDPMGQVYPISSLYLDNAEMRMFWSSALGELNRYKLRLRSYRDGDTPEVFVEVKRRVNKIVLKNRVPIHRDGVTPLLAGIARPDEILMEPENPKAQQDLKYFMDMMNTFQARPCTMVRYMREAFVGRDGELLRVTFDRDISCLPCTEFSPSVWRPDTYWRALNQIPVVLEIKYTDAHPDWVGDMIRSFGLVKCSMAKYVESVKKLGAEGISTFPGELKGLDTYQ